MKTLNQIREDLRVIRYYYEQKEQLERGAKSIGVSAVVQMVEKYVNYEKMILYNRFAM